MHCFFHLLNTQNSLFRKHRDWQEMTGALALQNSGRRQSTQALLPPIHPRSLFHLLWELGRYRLQLNSQYINFWGCPLLYPKPPLILFWLLFPQPGAGTTPTARRLLGGTNSPRKWVVFVLSLLGSGALLVVWKLHRSSFPLLKSPDLEA